MGGWLGCLPSLSQGFRVLQLPLLPLSSAFLCCLFHCLPLWLFISWTCVLLRTLTLFLRIWSTAHVLVFISSFALLAQFWLSLGDTNVWASWETVTNQPVMEIVFVFLHWAGWIFNILNDLFVQFIFNMTLENLNCYINFILFYACEHFACMYIWLPCGCLLPVEGRWGHHIPWDWSYRHWELPSGRWTWSPHLLQEQPPLQPLCL